MESVARAVLVAKGLLPAHARAVMPRYGAHLYATYARIRGGRLMRISVTEFLTSMMVLHLFLHRNAIVSGEALRMARLQSGFMVVQALVRGGRILALLRRNVRERKTRALIIAQRMKAVLGEYGPDYLWATLPWLAGASTTKHSRPVARR